MTQILNQVQADTYIPEIDQNKYKLTDIGPILTENNIHYQFLKYVNKNKPKIDITSRQGQTNYADFLIRSGFDHKIMSSRNPEEMKYLSLVDYIIDHGNFKKDRTGVCTHSIFGDVYRYNLQDNRWPILTTKKVFIKGVILELLWIITGSTNGLHLLKDGVKIWQGNGTRDFLDKNGLKGNIEHDLGPIYGHQWRYSGAPYLGADQDYTGQGVDQLADVIRQIKADPDSRRHIVCSWNPSQIKQMALPPCHALMQFYVANGQLSCIMYQRSCDMGLGVPFNIASYALLTHMIAHVTGLKAKEFIHILGDTHVYKTHFHSLKEQVKREPYEFPKINFKRKVSQITDFKLEDIEVVGYRSYESIKMEMAV